MVLGRKIGHGQEMTPRSKVKVTVPFIMNTEVKHKLIFYHYSIERLILRAFYAPTRGALVSILCCNQRPTNKCNLIVIIKKIHVELFE